MDFASIFRTKHGTILQQHVCFREGVFLLLLPQNHWNTSPYYRALPPFLENYFLFYSRDQLLKLLQLWEQREVTFWVRIAKIHPELNTGAAKIRACRWTRRYTEPSHRSHLLLKDYSCFLQCYVGYNMQNSIPEVSDRRKRKSSVC